MNSHRDAEEAIACTLILCMGACVLDSKHSELAAPAWVMLRKTQPPPTRAKISRSEVSSEANDSLRSASEATLYSLCRCTHPQCSASSSHKVVMCLCRAQRSRSI